MPRWDFIGNRCVAKCGLKVKSLKSRTPRRTNISIPARIYRKSGPWASDQSAPLPKRDTLLSRVGEFQHRYPEGKGPGAAPRRIGMVFGWSPIILNFGMTAPIACMKGWFLVWMAKAIRLYRVKPFGKWGCCIRDESYRVESAKLFIH